MKALIEVLDGQVKHCPINQKFDISSTDFYIVLNHNCALELCDSKGIKQLIDPPCLVAIGADFKGQIAINSFVENANISGFRLAACFIEKLNQQLNFRELCDGVFSGNVAVSFTLRPGIVDIYSALKAMVKKGCGNRSNDELLDINSMLLYLLMHFEQSASQAETRSYSSLSSRIRTLISKDLTKPWTLKEIAKLVYMSESTVKRKLNKEGTTFTDVLQAARLDTAQKMVCDSDASVSAIAELCGFKHASYFGACFRKEYGATPLAYRKQAQLRVN
ncbi:helix-turn-helix domain-containing protein [Vibrio parahaemolyticus]|uniref:helix-turn-helix domain-containing protein n=1 Tax=Vibrio parahaemolyticus TaxID=670 RepID=UPI00112464D8|nr:AraC family transcriptional regulator [Vibrio parahaemolyticus]TOI31430.1 AraC family transcriptional regulator [Vibrio parahaemolyticus]